MGRLRLENTPFGCGKVLTGLNKQDASLALVLSEECQGKQAAFAVKAVTASIVNRADQTQPDDPHSHNTVTRNHNIPPHSSAPDKPREEARGKNEPSGPRMEDGHDKGGRGDHAGNEGEGRISDFANSPHEPPNQSKLPTPTIVTTTSHQTENKPSNCVDSIRNPCHKAKTHPKP